MNQPSYYYHSLHNNDDNYNNCNYNYHGYNDGDDSNGDDDDNDSYACYMLYLDSFTIKVNVGFFLWFYLYIDSNAAYLVKLNTRSR